MDNFVSNLKIFRTIFENFRNVFKNFRTTMQACVEEGSVLVEAGDRNGKFGVERER